MTYQEKYSQRIELLERNRALLSGKYEVEICPYDRTALTVACTEKQFDAICRQLQCSGIYSGKKGVGIITNSGNTNDCNGRSFHPARYLFHKHRAGEKRVAKKPVLKS
jgi:N-acetylglutamate synthase/N-acetylornithine aminotransferase